MKSTNLSVSYLTDAADIGRWTRSSLSVHAGEFLGIVGESGCGKSTLLFAIAQLLSPPAEITSGRVVFRARTWCGSPTDELRHVRWRDYSVVMQSAMNALNPMKSIGAQFKDTMRAHERMSADGDPRHVRRRCCVWSASTPRTSRAIRIS